jgi:hypothetical protein
VRVRTIEHDVLILAEDLVECVRGNHTVESMTSVSRCNEIGAAAARARMADAARAEGLGRARRARPHRRRAEVL